MLPFNDLMAEYAKQNVVFLITHSGRYRDFASKYIRVEHGSFGSYIAGSDD